jgi:hypothetical protein
MATKYLPGENAQLTKIHSGISDRIDDELIRLQDATAVLYQERIDRLLDILVGLLAPAVTQAAIEQARATVKEMRP